MKQKKVTEGEELDNKINLMFLFCSCMLKLFVREPSLPK
jgi:hypothetical protein